MGVLSQLDRSTPATNRALRTAATSGICSSSLPTNGHTSSMAKSSIAPDIHQSLYVHLHFTAEVALYDVVTFDHLSKPSDLCFSEVPDSSGRIDANFIEDLRARRRPNPINVGEADAHCLVAWNVDPGDTSHDHPSPVLLLALALLVLWINANDADHSTPLDNFAALAATLDRCRYLHVIPASPATNQ